MAATTSAFDTASLVGVPTRRSRSLARWLARPPLVAAATVLLALLAAAGDWVTGIELPFTILYLVPIGVATWFANRRSGLAIAVFAVAFIAASLEHDQMSTGTILWNIAGATVLFLVAVWAADKLRLHLEREHALRRMAIDQLRHAERLNVIGTLAAGVAHELGTPLNVIAGCAELIAEDSHDVQRRTRMILEQVEKVSAIIRRLLDFGHRSIPTRARVDLASVATTTVELLTSTADKRHSKIALDAPHSVWLEGSKAELEQVLSNLILNALQAMDRGTVHVRVGVATRAGHEVACAEVQDEGCGIPRENIERIFDPFFTTKGVGEGTGLGLSISYGIVRDHGGSIEVASEPGHGARFAVLLPLAR